MDTTRKILLGTTAAAVGALLGSALWYGWVPSISATSRASAKNASARSMSDSAAVPARTPAKPSAAALQEFDELSNRLQVDLKSAPDRKAVAEKAITEFQAFLKKYPTDPASDRAALSMGNMQLLTGDAPAAIATFDRVAKQPRDPEIAPLATLFLGRAQAEAGQVDAARTTLQSLAEKGGDTPYGQAARQALGSQATRPGQRPPAFLMRDLQGRSQAPEMYRGKVLLLDFWATWCGPCLAELPGLKGLHDRYKDRGFAILGISLDTDATALRRFVQEEQVPWPQICDGRGPKGELPRRMGIIAIPAMILIDRRGVIRHVNLRGPRLEEAVKALLAEPAPT